MSMPIDEELQYIGKKYNDTYLSIVKREYSWYQKANDLRDAVKKAFLSINENGQVENHQSRYGIPKCLPLASEVALKHFDAQGITNFDNFKSIYQFVRDVEKEVKGFGELATYDVAMRIAHYCECGEHKDVYIHAGVRDGCRALGMNIKRRRIVPVEEFPAPLNQLTGDHLENLLCLYDKLANSSDEGYSDCFR